MKRVSVAVLFLLVFVLTSATQSLSVGETARYVLPFFASNPGSPTPHPHSAPPALTFLNVYNRAPVSCAVTIEFQYALDTEDDCSITATIPPKTSYAFCSLSECPFDSPASSSCSENLSGTGHAFVDSTSTAECAHIAVDAQQVIFQGPTSDSAIQSMSHLNVVTIHAGNKGD